MNEMEKQEIKIQSGLISKPYIAEKQIPIKTSCVFCGITTDNTVSFVNYKKDNCAFKYMPENSKSHMECYIEECVRISMEKILNEKNIT